MNFWQRIALVCSLAAGLGLLIFLSPIPGLAETSNSSAEQEFIVTLKSEPTLSDIAQGAKTIDQSSLPGRVSASATRLSLSSSAGPAFLTKLSADDPGLVQQLEQDPAVFTVQPNYYYQALMVPNDPYYSKQWNFALVKAPEAWDLDTIQPLYGGDPSIVVAVLDTGVAFENYQSYVKLPDFANTTFTAGYDFVNGDTHPNDDNGHGTHVTGTLAASTNNGAGAAGLAFQTSIMPVKILDSSGGGSTATIAQGVDFARTNGARVINLSLGGGDDDPVLHAAVKAAKDAGIVVVAATGNNAEPTLLYPAAYNEVIAVGATRYNSTRAPYSNYGTGIDLMAPGGDLDVDQNGDGQPDGILQETCTNSSCAAFGAYYYEGTSQASPHVAAAAALLLAAGASSANVQDILQSTATDIGPAGYDPDSGYGLINIFAALNKAMGDVTPPSGSLVINSGASATASPVVSLSVVASDTLGEVTAMAFSNNGAVYSGWEPYVASHAAWDMSDAATGGTTAEGVRTVYVHFQDKSGNVSTAATDTIVLDQSAPTSVTIKGWATDKRQRQFAASAVTGSAQPTFSFESVDALSGSGDYLVSFGEAATDPLTGGTQITASAYAPAVLTKAGTYVVSVRALDLVGNISEPATFSFRFAPQGVVIATGAGVRPRVSVYDSAGQLIHTFTAFSRRDQGGLSVATGDINADGLEEIIVGSGPGQNPEIRIYTHAGKLLKRIKVRSGEARDGVTVAVGNVRGDAALEIVAGSVAGAPEVRIYSQSGKLLKRFYAFDKIDAAGVAVAVGDFKGTGQAEIATTELGPAKPWVRIFSGQGKRTAAFKGNDLKIERGLALSAGDINADGAAEIITSESTGPKPQVKVYRRDGTRLSKFQPYPKGYSKGVAVAAVDMDSDGTDEIVTAPTGSGSKFVKALSMKGLVETGVSPIAPLSKVPSGGYRLAPLFLN